MDKSGSPERICELVRRAIDDLLEKGTECQKRVIEDLLPYFPRCRPDRMSDELATIWLGVLERRVEAECR